ncbi:MAG: alpha/beta hydrolase, partial [Syntrophobacteraceae bacterium]|nr:alpha/beta hydrolase [Syntrophobacteraceae bacterium]
MIHLLLILVTVYAALLCVVYIFQDRLVFFPERRFVISPRELGMEYEDVFFRAEDGT